MLGGPDCSHLVAPLAKFDRALTRAPASTAVRADHRQYAHARPDADRHGRDPRRWHDLGGEILSFAALSCRGTGSQLEQRWIERSS
jgi:hypothetical protein